MNAKLVKRNRKFFREVFGDQWRVIEKLFRKQYKKNNIARRMGVVR